MELITRKEESFQQIDLFSAAIDVPENQEKSVEMTEKTKGLELPADQTAAEKETKENLDLYHVIAPYVVEYIGEGMTKEEAAETFQVAKGQMHTWLKQLCRDSYVKCVKGRYVKG